MLEWSSEADCDAASAFVFQVTVLFAGQQIPKSPFEVNVDKALGDASKVTMKGPGIEPVGNIANKPTYFDIFTAGEGRLRPLTSVVLEA